MPRLQQSPNIFAPNIHHVSESSLESFLIHQDPRMLLYCLLIHQPSRIFFIYLFVMISYRQLVSTFWGSTPLESNTVPPYHCRLAVLTRWSRSLASRSFWTATGRRKTRRHGTCNVGHNAGVASCAFEAVIEQARCLLWVALRRIVRCRSPSAKLHRLRGGTRLFTSSPSM